jgi:hypothetical protein
VSGGPPLLLPRGVRDGRVGGVRRGATQLVVRTPGTLQAMCVCTSAPSTAASARLLLLTTACELYCLPLPAPLPNRYVADSHGVRCVEGAREWTWVACVGPCASSRWLTRTAGGAAATSQPTCSPLFEA